MLICVMEAVKHYFSAGVFLDQPQNTTIMENSSTAFHCSVFNSSFVIHWLINDSDADSAKFQDRGITLRVINDTASHLVIVGYKKNNNTLVQCLALQYENHYIITFFPSVVATMVVLGK